MAHKNLSPQLNIDPIGRTTSLEDIVGALASRGCTDLTTSIDLLACSTFPRAGGGFCDVYRGKLKDGDKIAIKTLRVYNRPGGDNDEQKVLKRAARELYNWSRLQQTNVLPLRGLAIFRGHISMISDWMDYGDLMSYTRVKPEANRMNLCMGIGAGLCYIHANGMAHGDLKAANVMVSSNGIAMIADFGNSSLKNLTLKFTNTTGLSLSVRWAAPELLLEDIGPEVTQEADIYAYGMTVLEVFTGKVPYEGIGDNQVLYRVAYECGIPPRPSRGISDGLWDILKSCWIRQPLERPTARGISDRLPSTAEALSASEENGEAQLEETTSTRLQGLSSDFALVTHETRHVYPPLPSSLSLGALEIQIKPSVTGSETRLLQFTEDGVKKNKE